MVDVTGSIETLMAALRTRIAEGDDAASAAAARALAGLAKHDLRVSEHHVVHLLNMAIQNDLGQAVTEILALLDPDAILWDEIAPHAVFHNRPNALRAILSQHLFPGFDMEVFYAAHQNGSTEILEMLAGLGDVDDALSAVQFAYEDEGISNRIVFPLDRAHVALADALIHGEHPWRRLRPEPVLVPCFLPPKPLQPPPHAASASLFSMPFDVMSHLVAFLDIKSIVRLRQTCASFSRVVPIETFHHMDQLEQLILHIFNAAHVAPNARAMLLGLLSSPALEGRVSDPNILHYLASVRTGDHALAHQLFIQLNKEYTALCAGFDLVLQSIGHILPCETIPPGHLCIFGELLRELPFMSWYPFLHVPAFQRAASMLVVPPLSDNPTAEQFTYALLLTLVQGNQDLALHLLKSIRQSGTRATTIRESLGHTIVLACRFGLQRVLAYVLGTVWTARDYQQCVTTCTAWCYAIAGENATALDMLLGWLPHTFDYLSIGNDDDLQASLRAAGKVGRLDMALKVVRRIGMIDPLRAMAHVVVPWAVPTSIEDGEARWTGVRSPPVRGSDLFFVS